MLVTQLLTDVPPRGGVPDAEQLERCVRAAVDAMAALAPIPRVAAIAVVPGTASYALPADFLRLRRFAGLPRQGRVIIGGEGIIPLSAASPTEEQISIAGGMLTIWPTPAYTLTRELHYDAGYLEVSGAYPTLTDAAGRTVAIKARSEALRLQAGVAAREAWSYQVGDERVSKEKLAAALTEQADALDRQFAAAAASLAGEGAGGSGTYGTRARYR